MDERTAAGDDGCTQVLQVERRRQQALQALDLGALDALFAPDLVHVHGNGMVHDKAALLRHIRERGSAVQVERGALDVRVIGDAAVIVGPIVNRMVLPDGSPRTLEGVATQVLRRDDGRWRFVSFQFTTLGG